MVSMCIKICTSRIANGQFYLLLYSACVLLNEIIFLSWFERHLNLMFFSLNKMYFYKTFPNRKLNQRFSYENKHIQCYDQWPYNRFHFWLLEIGNKYSN